MALIKGADSSDLNAGLWMFLLLRLTSVSKDRRSEVRNGSIQTLFRIFDTYGQQLGPEAWSSCLKIVVFKMMDPREVEEAESISQPSAQEQKSWNDTVNLVLGGIGTLYSNYFEIFSQQTDFRNTWTVFIKYLDGLLRRKSFDVNTTVFKVLASVLERVGGPENLSTENKEEVWKMWSSQGINLVEDISEGTRNGIQDTLTAFVDTFKPLYRLLEPTINAEIIEMTLDALSDCLLYPDSPAYFQDNEVLTPLQAAILNGIQVIRTDTPQVPTLMLKKLSYFSAIAFSASTLPPPKNPKQVRPSYIALASASMKQIEHICLKHVGEPEIYIEGALEEVLRSLRVPIALKYDFNLPSKIARKTPVSLWRNATNTTLAILVQALPSMDNLFIADTHQGPIWSQIAGLVASIVHVKSEKIEDPITIEADEEYDINAFRQLRALIIPLLGRPVVPEEAVMSYVLNIYRASLLYKVDPDPETEENWTAKQMARRLVARESGRTSELVLQKRKKMSYVCVDELLDLFAVEEESMCPVWRKIYYGGVTDHNFIIRLSGGATSGQRCFAIPRA